jgi:Ras-related protein Rab-11A
MLEESKGEPIGEVRESSISKNEGGDDRYTQVDNDVLNPIEGYVQKNPEEENKNQNGNEGGENTVPEKGDGPLRKGFKQYKIILLGDKGVGKSSLINKYVSNKFNPEAVIGDIVKKKKIELDNKTTVELLINDSTEEEKLGKYTKHYYKDAHGALIMFDITNRQSFTNLETWIEEVKINAPSDIVFCILGNKADLSSNRVVKFEEVQNIAGDDLYYEVSSKTGNNVSLAFEALAYAIQEKQKNEEKNPDKVIRGKDGRKTQDLNDINKDLVAKKKCC